MAKIRTRIGINQGTVEDPPDSGVYKKVIVERNVYADVKRNSRALEGQEKVNADLTVGNSLSIIANTYVSEHISAIQYIEWAGELWYVSNVDVKLPRLLLRLGGVYNGPTAPTPPTP